jgi:hypothetical protein
MESVKSFSLPEMMQRILQHPTATFSSMGEGREKILVSMPVASVERFRGTLETVRRGLEQTDPQTNVVIFCPTDAKIRRPCPQAASAKYGKISEGMLQPLARSINACQTNHLCPSIASFSATIWKS